MKSSREQFEEWFSDEINEGMKVSASGGYENLITQAAWMAWQASRAAIEIEMPTLIWDMSEVGSQHYDRDEVIDAIQSAGIKVKS